MEPLREPGDDTEDERLPNYSRILGELHRELEGLVPPVVFRWSAKRRPGVWMAAVDRLDQAILARYGRDRMQKEVELYKQTILELVSEYKNAMAHDKVERLFEELEERSRK